MSVLLNSVVAGAFAMIAFTVYNGLRASGQIQSNMLGVATGAMFASCAISHETHALHMLEPIVGWNVDEGLAMRRSIDWHLDAVDALTMSVAIWYWTQRPKFKALLDGGELFADLERRFNTQARVLEAKGRVADLLQRELAPKELPRASALAFDAVYVPAEDASSVGGDWYDVFELPDGRIAFSIGDVTGHGLEAAIVTSKARETIASAAFADDAPGDVLARANSILIQRGVPVITAIYGTIEPQSLRVAYATAGHPPPVFASRLSPATFGEYDGLALGVDPCATYPTFCRTLARGDLAVFYTDGVTEFARNIFAGEALLLTAATHVASSGASDPSQRILRDVLGKNAARDDIAILAISFIGDPVIIDGASDRTWKFDVKNAVGATILRREIVSKLSKHAPESDLESAELIIGELLGNVVKHTPGSIRSTLSWADGLARLTVVDGGSGFAPVPTLPDPLSEDGRGTFLIHRLANSVTYGSGTNGEFTIEVELPQNGDNGRTSLPTQSDVPTPSY